jgi:hypothetical protein
MSTLYDIRLGGQERRAWRADLERALAQELQVVGLHRTVDVAVVDSSRGDAAPSVMVFFGGPEASADEGAAKDVETALACGVVVIPVVADLARFQADVPEALRLINGFEWTGHDPAVRLARVLVRELGIEDRQRRVFISHCRADGLWAAEQLHDALSHIGFVPFIDRFAIRSGAQVQEAIAAALEDHAFLLLLETPAAHDSPWVFDEVDYALSHTMGTLILRWPGDPPQVPGSAGLPRLELGAADLTRNAQGADVLADPGLERVLAGVEEGHAIGLVRRRRMLVRSIEDAAGAAGATTVPLPDWRIHVEHGGASTLIGVTPRLPTATDLQLLDAARTAHGGDPSMLLVHSARSLREELVRHLEWVVGERDLELTPENAIGGRWQ